MKKLCSFLCLILILSFPILSGCGGGHSSTNNSTINQTTATGTSTAHTKGTVKLSVAWPKVSQKHATQGASSHIIPANTQSIVVEAVVSGTVIQSGTIDRSNGVTTGSDGTTVGTLTLSGIPTGTATIRARAYSASGGTGDLLATGESVVQIAPTDTNTATVTLTPISASGSSVIGNVTGTDGSLLGGVRVETTDGTGHLLTATTGADGKYSLAIPAGQRVITFAKCGYTTTQDVTVATNTAVTVNAQLPVYTGPDPTSPPVINVAPPQTDQVNGQAIVTGTVQQGNDSGGVIIVNGSEAEFSLDSTGSFSYVAVLVPGANIIQVRATNCMGTTLSDPLTVNYSPSGNTYFRVTLTWDGDGDVDLHTWDPNLEHSYFGNKAISTGSLDVDNTVADGPENFTCTTLTPGRYEIGVDAFAGSEGRLATVKVTVLSGPNQGQLYYYGPYTFTSTDGNSIYPVTGNTGSWWRPVDLVVGPDGSIVPDNPSVIALPHVLRGTLDVAREHSLKAHRKGDR